MKVIIQIETEKSFIEVLNMTIKEMNKDSTSKYYYEFEREDKANLFRDGVNVGTLRQLFVAEKEQNDEPIK